MVIIGAPKEKIPDLNKDEMFKNITFYSNTTAKHQAKIPYVDFNHQLDVGKYGDWNIEEIIKRNIKNVKKRMNIDYKNAKQKTT